MQVSIHRNEALQRHSALSDAFAVGKETGVLYSLGAHALDYDDDYFLTEYAQQYGRTYLEDEENLRKMARKRLAWIQHDCPPPARLLEIGSATGFFLDEARKLDYHVAGFEISKFASDYARKALQLEVSSGDIFAAFQNHELQPASYDLLCAFYTLEHFPDQVAIMRLIADCLIPGGVFAFALPSAHGPALEFNPVDWEQQHPADHYADYSPASLKKVLPMYSMRLQATRPASFHQNRCAGWKAWLPAPVYRWYAGRWSYGDTLEGLARKVGP